MQRRHSPHWRFFAMMSSLLALAAVLPLSGLLSSPAQAISTCTSTRSTNDSDEQAVVGMINSLRTSNGLPALIPTAALTRAAITKSSDMAASGTFAHDDVMSTMARFAACGNNTTGVGENIAAGNSDPGATFQQWLNSPEHKANMLSPNYKAIGIGRAYGSYQGFTNYPFWTAEFSDVVDSALPSTGNPVTNPTLPTFPVTPTTPLGGPGGTVGYGSFSGSGGSIPTGPALPFGVPTLPNGVGSFGGGGYVPSYPTGYGSSSGDVVGYGTMPAGGGAGFVPLSSGGQGTNVGYFP